MLTCVVCLSKNIHLDGFEICRNIWISVNLLILQGVAFFNDTENAKEFFIQLSYEIDDDNI
jgi:hypothetical protein